MISRTNTAMLVGLSPIQIEVEVDATQGIPHLLFIGLTSRATEEAKERITTALVNCGIRIRSKRTVVNLAPAEVPKSSSGFDLAIAVGLLKTYGEVKNSTDDTLFLGELSLDGSLKKIKGALPLAIAAKKFGFKHLVFPHENADEVSILSGIELHPVRHLHEYLNFARRKTPLPFLPHSAFRQSTSPLAFETDFADVRGQEFAKRALCISAAGGHHILLTGPPGIGKSLLAKTLISIMPPLTEPESIEVTSIHSVYGDSEQGVWSLPPFRSPHHSTSTGGLIGGSTHLRPGEISLAHKGVLFLDEFLEFNAAAIEALRQPLEEGSIFLSRAQGSTTFPAKFTLVAATNPCPCGYNGSSTKQCSCTKQSINQYRKKLSGPIYDRFDLHISVQKIEFEKLIEQKSHQESSAVIRQKVLSARARQQDRFNGQTFTLNSEVPSKLINTFIKIEPSARMFLNQAVKSLELSGRSYFKLIKVSQTIADLDPTSNGKVTKKHISEAMQYR